MVFRGALGWLWRVQHGDVLPYQFSFDEKETHVCQSYFQSLEYCFGGWTEPKRNTQYIYPKMNIVEFELVSLSWF